MLGFKFADRTFRFTCLERLNSDLRLTAAGAGLIPFNAKYRGQICSGGVEQLTEALDRSLDRAGIDRGDVVVILDGRSVLRSVFPLPWGVVDDPKMLKEHARWELARRCVGSGASENLEFEGVVRGRRGDQAVVDVWVSPPGIMEGYEQVVEGVGCKVVKWDCDQWAITRLFEAYVDPDERGELAAVVHMEAESLEIALVDDVGSVGVTSLRGDSEGPFRRTWDPDDSEEVAGEVVWWMQKLLERWLPVCRPAPAEVTRLMFTGSVEEPDRLLAALVRSLSIRVEIMDLHKIFSVDDTLMTSPLVQSNLGAFALCVGGALARIGA